MFLLIPTLLIMAILALFVIVAIAFDPKGPDDE